MIKSSDKLECDAASPRPRDVKVRDRRGRTLLFPALIWTTSLAVVALAGTAWLGTRASTIKSELESAAQLIPQLKDDISNDRSQDAAVKVAKFRSHTAAAKEAASDPLWTLASTVPGVGSNFSAITEVAQSSDDVANLGLAPLVRVLGAFDWNTFLPSSTGTNLEPLKRASPSIVAAADAVRLSAARLSDIDRRGLLPQVAEPLALAEERLQEVTGALDSAADASAIVPGMLGADQPRNYLLMIQNNAEARASGGIPGALAVLTLDRGKLTLSDQSTANSLGPMTPPIPIDPEQKRIYSATTGELMQDVNMTPDFPKAAKTAVSMWEQKTGTHLDGVFSVDPVALSYVLGPTGKVGMEDPRLQQFGSASLPSELNSGNIVPTLLADVYEKIPDPAFQDLYFANAAQEIFRVVSSGSLDATSVLAGLTRGMEARRVLLWSDHHEEQAILAKYPVSGSISGPSISPAQFGVYFNDGTGAKMDYYVKRTVQLIEQCPANGYREVSVRITSTNSAPTDAATSLPPYVTGGGVYGVPPGSVQTNVVAYGPVQSNVAAAAVAGTRKAFSAQRHVGRPVGTVTTRLAPGESSTVEFTFTEIVQQDEPNLNVTPTVQPVDQVILASEKRDCA